MRYTSLRKGLLAFLAVTVAVSQTSRPFSSDLVKRENSSPEEITGWTLGTFFLFASAPAEMNNARQTAMANALFTYLLTG